MNKVQSVSDARNKNKCTIKLNSVGLTMSGNNGFREEEWLIDRCGKCEKYRVSYYPPQSFKERKTPIDVIFIEECAFSGNQPNK